MRIMSLSEAKSKEKPYDFILVGAGLFNATLAYCANLSGKTCLVIERNYYVGGNLFTEWEDGIQIHKCGPHIFHTSSRPLWNFVNSITEFIPFQLNVYATNNGRIFNLPININTIEQLTGRSLQNHQDVRSCDLIPRNQIHDNPTTMEEFAISKVGELVYNTLIRDYTEKQWGIPGSQLPPEIIKRIPVRLDRNNNYFNDVYQGIPNYNKFISSLFTGSDIILGVDYNKIKKELVGMGGLIIYSGGIDEYYEGKYGWLEYRSLFFTHERYEFPSYQGCPIMNYTGPEEKFTRITEHKFFGNPAPDVPYTIITKEYPIKYIPRIFSSVILDPSYPIPTKENLRLYKKYSELKSETPAIFGGRLGCYKYFDMDDTMENAFDLAKNLNLLVPSL